MEITPSGEGGTKSVSSSSSSSSIHGDFSIDSNSVSSRSVVFFSLLSKVKWLIDKDYFNN